MLPNIQKSIKSEIFRAYCVGAFRNSKWEFTCPVPEQNICFQDDCEIDTAHSLFIRSNFRLKEWMVGTTWFEQEQTFKAHYNRCFSEKCGGVAVIIDIRGYGEINDFIIAGNVPPEIKFFVEIRDSLHTQLTNLELKIQQEANDFCYKLFLKK